MREEFIIVSDRHGIRAMSQEELVATCKATIQKLPVISRETVLQFDDDEWTRRERGIRRIWFERHLAEEGELVPSSEDSTSHLTSVMACPMGVSAFPILPLDHRIMYLNPSGADVLVYRLGILVRSLNGMLDQGDTKAIQLFMTYFDDGRITMSEVRDIFSVS